MTITNNKPKNLSARVALIFGEYKLPSQPYLSNWTKLLKSLGENEVQVFALKGDRNDGVHLINHSTLFQKINSLLLMTIRYPFLSTKWVHAKDYSKIVQRLTQLSEFGELLAHKPDIVHLVNSYLYPKFQSLVIQNITKTVVSFRGHDIMVRPWVTESWKDTLLEIFQNVDYLHFVSNNLKDHAIQLGAPPEKCFVIYPGVDPSFFCKQEAARSEYPGCFQITTVGRLTWEKNFQNAISAMDRLKKRGFRFHYNIIGAGPELEHLIYLIRTSKLEDQVTLWGELISDKVRDILAISDVYLQPSLSESFGVAVLEAQAMELPVVCSGVGGLPEIVTDGSNGILIAPMDVDSIVDAIVLLLDNESLRNELGRTGRSTIMQHFTLDHEISKWNQFYAKK